MNYGMYMDTKGMAISTLRNILIGSVVLIFIICSVSCRKMTGCVTERNYNEYHVEIPTVLYPAKDTFEVGDTIWIEQIFHDQLHDQRNGITLDFSDYSFGNWITTSDLLNLYNYPVKHSLTPVIGELARAGQGSMQIGYLHERDTFKFKMHVIMRERGLFKFGFLPQNVEANFSRCPTENLDLQFNLNGRGDNNYHMMQYSTDTLARQATKEVFDQIGSYCFYVR